MIGLQTIAVAFAMFSALPVPQFAWNQKKHAVCHVCLPAHRGGYWWAVVPVRRSAPADARKSGGVLPDPGLGHGRHPPGWLCRHLRCPFQLWRPGKEAGDPQRPPLRCLCGDPAVQLFCGLPCPCACVDFTPRVGLCWTLALVLERALSGLAVASFPMAKNTGLAHTFATAADRTTVHRVLMVLASLLSAALLALGGWALVLAAFLVFARYHVVSDKQFGGITGDLAGWFLQKAELWMLAALCAWPVGGGLL